VRSSFAARVSLVMGGASRRFATMACAAFVACAGCAAKSAPRVPVNASLEGTDGAAHALVAREPYAYLVVLFFSAECHVLRAHDDRVRKLAADFAPHKVQFLAVDSEVGATLEEGRVELSRRGYSFPLVVDRGGVIAQALGAEYAGYTVIVDRDGSVRYRGGLDSDRVRLREDATAYVREALADLVGGRAPRVPEGKALGCALRLR
jgi:hypothetical protein